MSLKFYSPKGALFALALFFCTTFAFPSGQDLVAQNPEITLRGNQVSIAPDRRGLLDEHFTSFQLIRLDEAPLHGSVDPSDMGRQNPRNLLPEQFRLRLNCGPILNGTVALSVNNMRGSNYRATASSPNGVETIAPPTVWTYEGGLVGESASQVRLSLFPGAITGYIRTPQETRFIEPLKNLDPTAQGDVYIIYSNLDVVPQTEAFCMAELVEERGQLLPHLDQQNEAFPNRELNQEPSQGILNQISPNHDQDQGIPNEDQIQENHHHEDHGQNTLLQSPGNSARHSSPSATPSEQANFSAGDIVAGCSILELATEADYEWYQYFGSSVPASLAAIDAILNQVEGLYCADMNVRFRMTNQNVHTVLADPYTSGTLLDRLIEFRGLWNSTAPYNTFPRDLAHMFTGTNLPGSAVGYAYVGVVCSSAGYGITQRYNSGTYGQVVVAAHEIGHNFSSPHSTSVSCGSGGSVMCPYVQSNSFYFSAATIAQINGHIASRSCLGPPDLSISPISATLCSSPTVNFVATFGPGYSYQWYRDSVAIPGATSNTHLDSVPGTYIVDIFDYDTTCGSCTASLVASLSGRTVIVTNTNDIGIGSLRDAILNSNACPGKDTILFAIPGAGPHIISPASALPAITDTVFIDGYSQAGAVEATASTPATLMIQLEGSSAGNASGLNITNTPDCKIAGMCLTNWIGFGSGFGAGIVLQNADRAEIVGNYIGTDPTGTVAGFNRQAGVIVSGNTEDAVIGTSDPADLNLISGNESSGIMITGDSGTVRRTIIQGNYLGTDITGTMRIPNFYGISIERADSTLIGGLGTDEGNLISANSFYGIELRGNGINSVVEGNLIGTDVSGTLSLGNGSAAFTFSFGAGIHVQSGPNRIGGFGAAARNVISGNARGIYVEPSFGSQQQSIPVTDVEIYANYIGVDINGILPLGNFATGILFNHAPGSIATPPIGPGDLKNNWVGGFLPEYANVIAFNGNATLSSQPHDSAGVAFRATFTPTNVRGNTRVLQNQIYFNGGLGIYIQPNALRFPSEYKAPVLISAVRDCPSNTTTINGELQSNDPNTSYRIEYFYNLVPDPSGTGEGETYLGSDVTLTDGAGNASFSTVFPAMDIPTGTCISATATALDTGNTSMFSNNMCITIDPLVITPQPDINVCEGGSVSLVDFDPFVDVTYTIPTFGVVTSDTLFWANPPVGSQVYVMSVDTCGRVAFDTIDINVISLPVVTLGPDTILCPGDTLLLDAGSGLTYTWQDFSSNQTFEVTSTGQYFVQARDVNFCFGRDTVDVLVDGPTVSLGPDTVFCSGGLLDAGYLEGGIYLWNVGGTDQYLAVDSAGDYSITLTDSNGCLATDTINITLDSVYVDLGNDTIHVLGDSLFAGNTGCNYTWSTGESTQTIFPPTPGAYQVTVTCPSGCAYVDEIILSSPPFDLESVSLSARSDGENGIRLDWSCLPDECVGNFALERGGMNGDLVGLASGELGSMGTTGGVGGSGARHLDAAPLRGWNRYRVRVEDPAGQVARSNIAWAYWEGEAWVTVSPVPAQDEFQLEWYLPDMSGGRVSAYDALGREIWRSELTGEEGAMEVDIRKWAKGVYILRIEGVNEGWVKELKVVSR